MSAEEQRDLDAALRRLEELIDRLDRLPDPAGRECARQLVELILDFHGIALARLITVVAQADGGRTLMARLAEDSQVRQLLLLHGLHPEDTEARVRQAVARLTPHLGVHGLRLEVVQVARGTARLRVLPSDGAPIKASLLWTIPGEIENAIVEAAPDIDEVVIDGLDSAQAAAVPAVSS